MNLAAEIAKEIFLARNQTKNISISEIYSIRILRLFSKWLNEQKLALDNEKYIQSYISFHNGVIEDFILPELKKEIYGKDLE